MLLAWVYITVGLIGLALIMARYRKAVWRRTIAAHCEAVGLRYVLDRRHRKSFVAHRFEWHGLVPAHEAASVDDLIRTPADRPDFVFAEALLKKHVLFERSPRPVFCGALILQDLTGSLAKQSCQCVEFERSGDGGWVVPGRLAAALPGKEPVSSAVIRLAEALRAESIAVALEDGWLFVAIEHCRGSFPVSRFWRRRRDLGVFAPILQDIADLARLADARRVGPLPLRAARVLPAPVSGRYPLVPPGAILKVYTAISMIVLFFLFLSLL